MEGSNVRLLEFFGVVPEGIIIDNLKSGVKQGCRYEPELNRAFEEFGAHYGTAIIPARPRKPRDKSKVEKAVQEVERWILAPLRNQRFASIRQMNETIRRSLPEFNNRQMRSYKASRKELFETIDKPQLKALPPQTFSVGEWKQVTVGLDYHIQVEHNYYSVPYWLARQTIWTRLSEHLVEIFYSNQRIASHRLLPEKHKFSTIEAHLPPNHLAMKSQTPDAFLNWAKTIGEETTKLVQSMLDEAQHKVLAFRSILGLQRLAKKFSISGLERAAQVANERGIYSQRFVRKILEEGSFGVTVADEPPVVHANVRGPNYYH